MQSTFGKNIRVSIWGGSHEPAIGVDIEGIPVGTRIDMNQLRAFLKRRAPGNSPFATKRKEPDLPIPVAGIAAWDEETPPEQAGDPGQVDSDTGNPTSSNFTRVAGDPGALTEASVIITTAPLISFEIRNTDTRSGDYKGLRAVPRPGHADYTARLRYGDTLNMAGGGPFSARMTAPLCIAGGIALQMLKEKNIEIGAHLYAIAGIEDTPLDPVSVSAETLAKLRKMEFPVLSETAGEKMAQAILQARKRPGFRGRHRRSVCDRTARRHRRSYVRWSGKLPGTDLLRHTGRKRRRIRRRISRSRASRLRKQ